MSHTQALLVLFLFNVLDFPLMLFGMNSLHATTCGLKKGRVNTAGAIVVDYLLSYRPDLHNRVYRPGCLSPER